MAFGRQLLSRDFASLPELVREHAKRAPERAALIQGESVDYAALADAMDRVAGRLAREAAGAVVAILADGSIDYVTAFLGILASGRAAAPIAPSGTAESIGAMIADSGASHVFADTAAAERMGGWPASLRVATIGDGALAHWIEDETPISPRPEIAPGDAFNIIYSSGTTGRPKGIVQSHAMRWNTIRAGAALGYDDAVTLVATPLYSNTTLAALLPTLALGSSAVLLPKFSTAAFLDLAERHRATNAMLVPVQYRRLMDEPDFDAHDLSAFRLKLCTSAPFPADLKAEVLARWPGRLIEFYASTEGAGGCSLEADRFPDKLHTVGRPIPGYDVRIVDEEGREVPAGEAGEIVSRSPGMMTGYHGLEEATRSTEWHDGEGRRFLRTGDIGRFDEDGFVILLDRKKDMIISGGFNLYPSDLEAVLSQHPAVAEAAVVGVPSRQWGETPVAFVVLRPGAEERPEALRDWFDARVGKTQRLHDLRRVENLPRSAIGKVLKGDLRAAYQDARL